MIAIAPVALEKSAPLSALLGEPVRGVRPLTMEELDKNYGLVWYRARLPASGKGALQVGGVRDMALLYQSGRRIGTLDRRRGDTSVELEVQAGVSLDVQVENLGRINYGPRMVDERKGLLGPVRFAGKPVLDWQMPPLPLDDLSALRFTSAAQAAPAFHRGHFDLEVLGDSFIDLRGWGRGHVWINGHHLGRYWHIGPQQTLLVPAQWLRHGSNEVIVLELETDTPPRRVQGLANPVFDTPSGAA